LNTKSFLVCILFVASCFSADLLTVFGSGWKFNVNEPSGWYGDIEVANKIDYNIVFYKKGHSFSLNNLLIGIRINTKYDENLLDDLNFDMETYKNKYPKIIFKDLSILHPKYTTFSKLYIRSQTHYEYVVFMNPGNIFPFKFSVVMSCSTEVPNSDMNVFKSIINSISMIPNDTINTTYKVALRLADHNLTSTSGKDYDTTFAANCGPWLVDVLSQCTSNLKKATIKPNTFLFCISDVGEINNIIAEHDDNLSGCIKRPFWEHKYPEPPHQSWWVKLDIHFTN
jgi:hypothetical protein